MASGQIVNNLSQPREKENWREKWNKLTKHTPVFHTKILSNPCCIFTCSAVSCHAGGEHNTSWWLTYFTVTQLSFSFKCHVFTVLFRLQYYEFFLSLNPNLRTFSDAKENINSHSIVFLLFTFSAVTSAPPCIAFLLYAFLSPAWLLSFSLQWLLSDTAECSLLL